MNDFPIDSLRFDADGLVPAIVQDAATKTVLMLGFMNRDALLRTVQEGKVCFWSRSRQKFWLKGETSGMYLQTRAVRVNCENNSLLILADPIGPTCHTGHETCYYRQANGVTGDTSESIDALGDDTGWNEILPVVTPPEALYARK